MKGIVVDDDRGVLLAIVFLFAHDIHVHVRHEVLVRERCERRKLVDVVSLDHVALGEDGLQDLGLVRIECSQLAGRKVTWIDDIKFLHRLCAHSHMQHIRTRSQMCTCE